MLYERPVDDVAPALSTDRFFPVATVPDADGIMPFEDMRELLDVSAPAADPAPQQAFGDHASVEAAQPADAPAEPA